jgi:hypothetical protein
MCGTTRSDVPRARTRIRSDDVRPSDAEREEIVSQLRAHHADGRLDVDELERRVARAYTTTTRRHLVEMTRDLPRPRRRSQDRNLNEAAYREHLRTYVAVMALLVVIWGLTGMGYFWPIWPMLGWGIGVFSHRGSLRLTRPHARRRPAT